MFFFWGDGNKDSPFGASAGWRLVVYWLDVFRDDKGGRGGVECGGRVGWGGSWAGVLGGLKMKV